MILHAPKSLWLRLIIGLVGISAAAVLASMALFFYSFKAKNLEFRERTLERQASIIANVLQRAGSGEAIQLADLSGGLQKDEGRYAIVSQHGELLSASPGVRQPLSPIDAGVARDFFVLHGKKGRPPLYGISTSGTYGGQAVRIQIAFEAGGSAFDTGLKDFTRDLAWMWLSFVSLLLIFNLTVARIGLLPLRRAAASAAAIGPTDASVRLPERDLPDEVLSLVRAVNQALDRMERAFVAQRTFIADASHELRTPVAILKSHADLLRPDIGTGELKQEIAAIERLVNQLLDHARLDGMRIEAGSVADLKAIAIEVASQIGPAAIGDGKSIEVVTTLDKLCVRGAHDFLYRAVRNLVENGLAHTPAGTTISIVLVPPATLSVRDWGPGVPMALRKTIFQQFWQGNRDRGGAGLGMDIVARTVKEHGGTIEIADAPGGGALITLAFPTIAEVT